MKIVGRFKLTMWSYSLRIECYDRSRLQQYYIFFDLRCELPELKEPGPRNSTLLLVYKVTVGYRLIIILISGIVCIASNANTGHAGDWTDNARIVVKSSIGNQGNPFLMTAIFQSGTYFVTWLICL